MSLVADKRRYGTSVSSAIVRSSFLAAVVVLSADFEACAGQPADRGYVPSQKIDKALRSLDEYYGDVETSVNCKRDRYVVAKTICRDKYLYNLATLNSRVCVLSIENATGTRLDDHKYYHLSYINRDECPSSKKKEECLPPCVTKSKGKMKYGLIPPTTCVTKKCIYEFYKKEINDSGGDVSPFFNSGQDVTKPVP